LDHYGLGERRAGIWTARGALQALPFDSLIAAAREPKARPVGISNLGATCYLNCMLQVLNLLPHFRTELFRWAEAVGEPHALDTESMPASSTPRKWLQHAQLYALASVLAHLSHGELGHVQADDFAVLMGLSEHVQEDASELLRKLIEHAQVVMSSCTAAKS
jgi:ubiquitin C-terminal hydrolase